MHLTNIVNRLSDLAVSLVVRSTVVPEIDVTGAGENRFQLFDDVCDRLATAAEPGGLLVALDDLQWADVPTLRLLQAVTGRVAGSKLFIVALYRGSELKPSSDLTAAVTALERERVTRRLPLGALAPAEVKELAAQVWRGPVEDSLLRSVVERAEGNPLFVVELMHLAAASGGADHRVPGGVREVIARRLNRLPDATRRLVRQASVLGCDFSLAKLADLTGRSPLSLAELLDQAVIASLLQSLDGHGTDSATRSSRRPPTKNCP